MGSVLAAIWHVFGLMTLVACGSIGAAGAHEAHAAAAATEPLAPGYGQLSYTAPAAGTYRLPAQGAAADGRVLAEDGRATSLHALFGDRLTVLGFIYTRCSDANGCPLASFVMSQAAARVAADPDLAAQVRFLSLSFDPAHDTPSRLAEYARSFRKRGVDWRFLTAQDEASLAPILAAYGQDVARDESGTIAHVLRVFLIDRAGRVRNQYSTSYLHADMLLADLRTVLLDSPAEAAATAMETAPLTAGDPRAGYDSAGFVTRSRALSTRRGAPADLESALRSPPNGLPLPAGPVPTDRQIRLGRRLFFDRRLAHNDTLACASCHIPEQGFTHNERATPIGVEGRTVKRNAPTLFNVAYQRRLFHDARESRLEQQIWGPLLAHNEMANPSIGYVVDELAAAPEYRAEFAAAFDGRAPDMETIGAALAAYERALVSANSPFDRWHYAGERDALNAEARRGFALFTGKAGCSGCHTIEARHALFTDQALHNTGVGYRQSMQRKAAGPVLVAPGTAIAIKADAVLASAEPPPHDLGRYEVTQDPADRWRYRTPTLRNVALTAPYMHDGSIATLADVVSYYNDGGVPNEGLDPRIRTLSLSAGEQRDLVAFLASLTGDNVEALVLDAFAEPIRDRGRREP